VVGVLAVLGHVAAEAVELLFEGCHV
jgi:hypothetical protein